MKKFNKLLNLSVTCTENLYKIIYLIKLNIIVYVIFLLNIWMKQEIILFMNMNMKRKINFLKLNKLKFNVEPRS